MQDEHGAALVTVLLFMTLTFILITGMLAVTGNEVVISGIQRDSTRAMDYAQAGIQEAIRRMEEGRPYTNGFTSALHSGTTVSVLRRFVGTNSAYQEIQAQSLVGRARRRLSFLVLQQVISFPPNITFAASVIEQGSAQIICGDAYARTFIQYSHYPQQSAGCTEPPPISYAGWRISKVASDDGPAVDPCYTNAQCIANNSTNDNVARWHPGSRRTEPETSTVGKDIKNQTLKCPAGGGGSLPTETITGVRATSPTDCATDLDCQLTPYWETVNVYGFDTDDPDGAGAAPPQAVNSPLPCGLPYRIVSVTFDAEDATLRTRLIKTIVFEQWFANYWRFDTTKMKAVKRDGSACTDAYCLPGSVEPNLLGYPTLGAVPPFPDMSTVESNYDCKVDGGGLGGEISELPLNCTDPAGTQSDLGCKDPEMSCSPPGSRPVSVVLSGGDWTINANLKGHGTLVVDGNLTINGDFEYWGTIIVKGVLTLGAGNATIHGGMVADSTLKISGNITVEGGGTVSNVPTGRSIIIGRGWWER